MAGFKEDLEIIKGNIAIIKSDLKSKVDYDEFAALEKRVSKVELRVRK